jgi:hypothetical protein
MTIKQQGGVFGRNPSFNDVDVNTLDVAGQVTAGSLNVDAGTLFVDAVNNFVGIGTAAPGDRLTVNGNIYLGATSRTVYTGGSADLMLQTNTGNTLISRDNGSTEIARFTTTGMAFPSGNGIDFSATSGTGTSELFDDYEEGTYTATFTPETSGSITVNPSFDTLQYTKIGRSVTVSGFLQVSSVSSPVGGSVKVSLPFNIASLSKNGGYIGTSCYAKGAVQAVLGFNGNAFVYITVDASTVASPDNFRFSFSFIAA